MAGVTMHPIKKKVFGKGLALKELRPYIGHLCDLKEKIIKIAVDADMHPEVLLEWIIEQTEFTHCEDGYDTADDTEEEGPETEETENEEET